MQTNQTRVRPASFTAGTVAAVAAGGVVGTAARYGVSLLLPATAGAMPWATVLVNLTGSLALGLVVAALGQRPSAPEWARPLLATGLLGSYTTYSAFAVETNVLATSRPLLAAGYVALSVLGGIAAATLGMRGGRR